MHIGKEDTHCVFMDRDLLPGISWCSCPAADYFHLKVLRVQARYPKGHLAQEDVKCRDRTNPNDALVVPLCHSVQVKSQARN